MPQVPKLACDGEQISREHGLCLSGMQPIVVYDGGEQKGTDA
jgi:hypothetical protein